MFVYYAANYQASGALKLVYKWEPEPFAWSMLTGFGAFILASLVTRAEPAERIERFFDNMRRSTDLEGLPEGQPKPWPPSRGQDLLLLDLTGWLTPERWAPLLLPLPRRPRGVSPRVGDGRPAGWPGVGIDADWQAVAPGPGEPRAGKHSRNPARFKIQGPIAKPGGRRGSSSFPSSSLGTSRKQKLNPEPRTPNPSPRSQAPAWERVGSKN